MVSIFLYAFQGVKQVSFIIDSGIEAKPWRLGKAHTRSDMSV
jgi:hypothetical protein